MNILMVIGKAEIAIATWVYDNILTPIWTALKDWVESDAEEDLKAFGDGLLEVLKGALDLAGEGLEWVIDNLITPLIDEIKAYATDGRLEEDMNQLGEDTRNFIIAAMKFYAENMQWVAENIITPIVEALVNWVENDAEEDLKAFGEGVLGVIKAVADFTEDAPTFIKDKIIQPFIEGFLGLDFAALETAAATIGTSIMNAISGAISGAVSTVEGAVKSAINDIIPDTLTIDFGSVNLGIKTVEFGSRTFNIGNPFPGYAEGGVYPANQPHWVGEEGIELNVPRSSGLIINNDQLKTALNVLGSGSMASPMAPAMAGAGAGGGDVNINGGIQISIDGSAVPAGSSPADVAEAVWAKFREATRRAGGGTVGASGT
jgi:hypothetical protein